MAGTTNQNLISGHKFQSHRGGGYQSICPRVILEFHRKVWKGKNVNKKEQAKYQYHVVPSVHLILSPIRSFPHPPHPFLNCVCRLLFLTLLLLVIRRGGGGWLKILRIEEPSYRFVEWFLRHGPCPWKREKGKEISCSVSLFTFDTPLLLLLFPRPCASTLLCPLCFNYYLGMYILCKHNM